MADHESTGHNVSRVKVGQPLGRPTSIPPLWNERETFDSYTPENSLTVQTDLSYLVFC